MKIRFTTSNLNKLFILLTVSSMLVSCGSYISSTYDDGIYNDETVRRENKKVIILNKTEYSKYNENYFAEELDLVAEIKSDDIFLNADNYTSIDSTSIDTENIQGYTPNQAWGTGENNDVVVNININQNPYWMGNIWGYDAFRFNYWSFNRRGFNNWGWRNNYFYGNGFYGDIWSNYDPYGYNRYNRYSYHGIRYRRNGRYHKVRNQRNGRYAYNGRRAATTRARLQINNYGKAANNKFTKKNKRTVRSNRTNNSISNSRNHVKKKPIRIRENTKNTRNRKYTRNNQTKKPSRNTINTRNNRSSNRSVNTRSNHSSTRSSGRSSSRGSSRRKN